MNILHMTSEQDFITHATRWRLKALKASMAYGASTIEADDVAQEVLLKLWQMRSTLERYRNVEALVSVMARNLTISAHRNPHFEKLPESAPRLADVSPTPEETLIGQETMEHLEMTLKQLPPKQHAVLMMRQVEHRSYREIGMLLGIEENSAKTLLSRARKWLLNELNTDSL